MKIEILPEAQADLDEGYWFYENQAAGLGEYFLTSIVSDIRSLQLFAGIHSLFRNKHRMLTSRFPYSVFYRVEDKTVRVYAITDNRRDPDWINKRLY
jgi:plasmid stabilization system protein ParE